MRLGLRLGVTAVLLVGGAVGVVAAGWFLLSEGLDRAEKWVSIVGMCLSIALSVGGLVFGWLTWRQSRLDGRIARSVTAGGAGAVGVGGRSGAEIRTEVSGMAPISQRPGEGAGVHADGTGSVAVGGDSNAPISTRVTGPGGEQRP